jgi:prepilin-type N-terminal cleavage/methylation domain-containing protein
MRKAGTQGAASAAARRDRGYTLIEVVVTVTLMALVVAPILAAVATAVRESSRSRSAAQVETTIVNAADRVNRAPKVCDYNVYVKAAVRAQQWSPDTATIVEEHYVPPADLEDQGQWAAGACEIETATDLLVQRITITITSPDGNVSRQIQVVKSDV